MSRYKVYNLRQNEPVNLDKALCVASYFTMGFVGMAWIIITAVLGKTQTRFAKYHVFQSLFISIIIYLIDLVKGIILPVVSYLPIIGKLVNTADFWLTQANIFWGMPLVSFIIIAVLLYLSLGAIVGKYAEIPYISPMVKQMLGY